MNKFAILAVFAIFGCVAAVAEPTELDSQLALIPGNDEETKYLSGQNVVFSTYCIEARDETVKFMKSKANEAAASMFSTFFKSANDIGEEVLAANKRAVEEGASAIKAASQHVPENASQREKTEQLSLLQTIGRAAKAIVSSVVQAATGEFYTRVQRLKEEVGAEEVKNMINTVCRQVSNDLNQTLDYKLASAKKAVKSADPSIDVSAVTVPKVGCVTAGRIAKLSQFCNLITLCGPSIYPFLGL